MNESPSDEALNAAAELLAAMKETRGKRAVRDGVLDELFSILRRHKIGEVLKVRTDGGFITYEIFAVNEPQNRIREDCDRSVLEMFAFGEEGQEHEDALEIRKLLREMREAAADEQNAKKRAHAILERLIEVAR